MNLNATLFDSAVDSAHEKQTADTVTQCANFDAVRMVVAELNAPEFELERTVVLLRYFQGLEVAEIASVLNLTEAIVRSMLKSVRSRLLTVETVF